MYVRPGHKPEQMSRNQAPQEQGERLLTLPRGEGEELRLSRDVYNGHEYLSLRIWTQDKFTHEHWPTKRGVSIRLGEAAAISEALAAIEAPGPGADRPQARPQSRPAFRLDGNGRRKPPAATTTGTPQPPFDPAGSRPGFSEFDEPMP